MTSVRTFPHADIAAFIEHDTPPDGLMCPIGRNLIRQAVRINGDTTDKVYDAKTIAYALGQDRRNPLTRAPVQREPALVADGARQQHLANFRAQLLGYTKVAAFCAERGLPMPNGEKSLLANGAHPRQLAVAQAMRNAHVSRQARKPLPQPPAAADPIVRGEEQLNELVTQATDAADAADAVTLAAHEAAEQGTRSAMEADRVAHRASAPQQVPSVEYARARAGIVPREEYAAEFGPLVADAVVETVQEPTLHNLQRLARLAQASGQPLVEILLFGGGDVLEAILDDEAYRTLLPHLHLLLPGAGDSSDDAELGVRWLDPQRSQLYVGEVQGEMAHGEGVSRTLRNATAYAMGHWRNGRLHGLGVERRDAVDTVGFNMFHPGEEQVLACGRFEAGQLRQGVISLGEHLLRGTFEDRRPSGPGDVTTPACRRRGLWEHGIMVEGEVVWHHNNTRLRLGGAGNALVGTIDYADGMVYRGEVTWSGQREGYGTWESRNSEVRIAGRWHADVVQSPVAILYEGHRHFLAFDSPVVPHIILRDSFGAEFR